MIKSRKRTKKSLAIRFALVFAIGIIGGFWVLKFFVLGALCKLNLDYHFAHAMRMYASEDTDKRYPPISDSSGMFIVSYDITLKYLGSDITENTFCQSLPQDFLNLPVEEQFDQAPYFYTGYILENEEQFIAFLESYPSFIESKADFNEDLPAPAGKGSYGGDHFVRFSESIAEKNKESTIPLVFELPTYTDKGMKFRHGKKNCFVKYLNGWVVIIPEGQFPMTPTILQKIGELKQHSKSHAQ